MIQTIPEKLKWYTWKPTQPHEFPCAWCHSRLAEFKRQVRYGVVDVTLCMCESCACGVDDGEIENAIKNQEI